MKHIDKKSSIYVHGTIEIKNKDYIDTNVAILKLKKWTNIGTNIAIMKLLTTFRDKQTKILHSVLGVKWSFHLLLNTVT